MIVAFTGLAGSGKTTSSNYLVDTKKYKKINFKDGLVLAMHNGMQGTIQEICKLMETQDYDGRAGGAWTEERLFAEKPAIFRCLMQDVGTGLFRIQINQNYWVDKWKETAREAMRNGYSIVVDDCRFLNEAKAIKDLGGKIIRIARTDITNTGSHVSEVEQGQIEDDVTFSCGKGEHDLLYSLINEYIQENGD